jgi:hypothetical protein
MPLKRSQRKVRRPEPYGRSATIYIHGHGELRDNTRPISFQVPRNLSIYIASGPGVALSEELGNDMLANRPVPINLPLAWVDRPGQPVYTRGDEGRGRHLRYPMYCPNYTLKPPKDLEDLSERDDVFQAEKPMQFYAIVNGFKGQYDIIVWTNCTVLRGPKGKLRGRVMDDLGDV